MEIHGYIYMAFGHRMSPWPTMQGNFKMVLFHTGAHTGRKNPALRSLQGSSSKAVFHKKR